MACPSTFVPPMPYEIGYSFANYQALNPSKPLPGQRLDVELAGVAGAIQELLCALQAIQRSDGTLANGVVTYDSLSPSLVLAMGIAAPIAPIAPLQVVQMKVVLSYIGAVGTVEQVIPADVNSIAAIQWMSGGVLNVGDPLWQLIETALGYTDAMMGVLAARAFSIAALAPAGAVDVAQVKKALAASGQVGAIGQQIPADPNSIVNIRWTTGGKTTSTDELGTFLTGIGLNAATLYAAAVGL